MLGHCGVNRIEYTYSSQVHYGVLQVRKGSLRNRSYSSYIPEIYASVYEF